jgi:4-hydroxybenzoate polyprenyltransferase
MSAIPGTQTAFQRSRMLLPLRLLSCIRLDEVLLLQGTPLFGALFSMGTLTKAKGLDLLVFAAASVCLVAYVFVLNDLSGASTDLRDPNRVAAVFSARGISRTAISWLCALLLGLSLLLLIPFGWTPLLIALALAILGGLYSAPRLPMKGVPVLNSALHFAGGLLQFLMGYSLFQALDGRSIMIGSFFGLTFVAGHLAHEARDHSSDLSNQIRTNAVRFGPARSFAAAFFFFTVADALLLVMAGYGVVPRILLAAAALYPLHLWWTVQTSRAGLTFENIRRLQVRYRVIYAIIGLIMVAALVRVR